MRHTWTYPGEAYTEDGSPGAPITCHISVQEGEFSGVNPEGVLCYSTTCSGDVEMLFMAEILRLAARVKELEFCLSQVHGYMDWHLPADLGNAHMRVRNDLARLLGPSNSGPFEHEEPVIKLEDRIATLAAENERLTGWLRRIEGGERPFEEADTLRQWAYEAITLQREP